MAVSEANAFGAIEVRKSPARHGQPPVTFIVFYCRDR